MDLVTFLAARLDEDETAARESYYEGQRWITEEEGVYRWPDDELVHMADRKADARHIARHDPARVLREVEADRAFLRLYEQNQGAEFPDFDGGYQSSLEDVIKIRAARFSDHPDFSEEWKP